MSKAEAVRVLVSEHFDTEPELQQIVWLPEGEPDNELRLIHVHEETIRTDRVEPFRFAPTPDVPYAVRLAQVSPDEWDRVEKGQIRLPAGWTLRGHQSYSRQGTAA